MSKTKNIAVVGATGVVGETMLDILASRRFPVGEVHALASERSLGKTVSFGQRELEVNRLDEFDFGGVDIALFSAGASVSAEFAPKAAAAGCVVIDNTSHFRNDEDIPLVVPEVNPQAIAGYQSRGIIANPNCSTIQMLVALKPLHDEAGIRRIDVCTYQAVSGAGRAAMEELVRQTTCLLNGRPLEIAGDGRQIAFNAVPHIDAFQDNGYTREEMKMVWETHKILGDDTIAVNPTTVRIPVFYGHSEAVHLQLEQALSAADARTILQGAPGVEVVDERQTGGYPTAVSDSSGNDAVFVGRIRDDISRENGLNLWIVADNIRKGAALNSVQIAEILAKNYL